MRNVPNIKRTDGTEKKDFIYIYAIYTYLFIIENLKKIKSNEHFDIGNSKLVELKIWVLKILVIFKEFFFKLDFGLIKFW